MTAADVTTRLETNDPTCEDVVVTATDGETYTAAKLGTVIGAHATLLEDTDTLSIPVSCAVSGATVTLHCTGLSDKKVFLTLKGRK